MSDGPIRTQSLALIGDFLLRWSNMEHILHLGIAAATKLDPLMNTVVCANLTVREKLNILRTMVDISSCGPETKKRFKTLLRDITDYAPTRNMIAHDYFLPSEDSPAIGFMTTKAKGKFDTPTVLWEEDDFRKEYAKIEEFQQEALQLVIALEHATFSAEELNIPMKLTHSSARQHHHDHPRQDDPGSHPASNQTPPERPDETRA